MGGESVQVAEHSANKQLSSGMNGQYNYPLTSASPQMMRGPPSTSEVTCLMCCHGQVDVMLDPCRHQFHAMCIERHFKDDRRCPACWSEVQTQHPVMSPSQYNYASSHREVPMAPAGPPAPAANMRKGKWTAEESAYCDRLIEEFKKGNLPLAEGTTLRTFLSKLLNCDPMRISKKYTGDQCIGKIIFRRREDAIPAEEAERIRKELAELEQKYLERERYNQRRREKRLESEVSRDKNRYQGVRSASGKAPATSAPYPTVKSEPHAPYQHASRSDESSQMDSFPRVSSIDSFSVLFPRVASIENMSASNVSNEQKMAATSAPIAPPQDLNSYMVRTPSLDQLSSLLQEHAPASPKAKEEKKEENRKSGAPKPSNKMPRSSSGIFPRVPSMEKMARVPSLEKLPRISSMDKLGTSSGPDKMPRIPSTDKLPRVPSLDKFSRVLSSSDMFSSKMQGSDSMSSFPSFTNLSSMSNSASHDKLNALGHKATFPRNSSIEDILSLVASSDSNGGMASSGSHMQLNALAAVAEESHDRKRRVESEESGETKKARLSAGVM